MTGAATISVVTTNYNHGRFITRCVESVERQGELFDEHVIVDDGSTDDSVAIVRELARTRPRIRPVELERNQGVIAALLRAIQEAKGEFIVCLAADDELPDGALAAVAEVLRLDPSAAMISGDMEYYFEATNRIVRRRYFNADKPVYLSPDDIVAQLRRGLHVLRGHGSSVNRKSALLVGFEETGLRWHQDLFLADVAAFRTGFWYVPAVMRRFGLGESNFSKGAHDPQAQQEVFDTIFRLLASPEFADVRARFRDSSNLAMHPFVLRYLLRHPEHREFLTANLVWNVLKFDALRLLSRLLPRPVIDFLVRLRTRLVAR